MSENGKTESRPTKRVVLRRERVLVLPEGYGPLSAENQKAIATVLGVKGSKLPVAEAWLPVGEFEGHSKTNSIEAHAGKPGTPDALPGDYKAVPVSAWAGGERYVKPSEPKVEREPLT